MFTIFTSEWIENFRTPLAFCGFVWVR
eukprot:COSAG04_NODE_9255_length_882_cov_1.060026_1_plen_26_part_10